jgi:hypothetical protein
MGCACKRKLAIEKKYGQKIKETFVKKAARIGFKVSLYVITVLLAIVTIPIVLMVVLFNIFFRHNAGIVMPNFLSKYLA